MAIKTFKITGDKELIRTLKRIERRNPVVVAAALFQEGEKIMADSKENFVPVDLGALKNSGRVSKPELKQPISVTLSYGGVAKAYALAVHEHPSGHSPPSWSGGVTFNRGGPKYLEKPVMEAVPEFLRNIGNKVRLSLGKL